MNDIKHLTPFRFWAEKVIPLVYEESLSYYELLCKVIDYLNKMGGDFNALLDNFSEFSEDMTGKFNNLSDEFSALVEFAYTNFPAYVNNKLDEMAEDGTLTALIAPYLPFVTPEMFGAKGDGVTDDTAAWQSAVDTGSPVRATSKLYKCGQINVTKNIEIDANNADFVCTATILFNCTGSIIDSIKSAEYVADTAKYQLTDAEFADYTGFAFVKGTNHFLTSRDYYFGGFVCQFENGAMLESMPVSANDGEGTVDIDLIAPITLKISNIGNISHTADGQCRSIKITYGLNCLVENINNHTFSSYCCIDFEGCLSCKAINLNIVGFLGTTGTNSYIIAFSDSSFCSVERSHLYNKYWHCVTTGANYLCWKNSIVNCVLLNDTGGAFVDHDNGISTFVQNCVVAGLVIGGKGIVKDTKIISSNDVQKTCWLVIQLCTDHNLTGATLKDVEILPDPTTPYNASGINIMGYTTNADQTFYADNILIENVKTKGESIIKFGFVSETNSNWVVNNVTIRDVIFGDSSYILFGATGGNVDQTNSKILIDNIRGVSDTKHPDIGSNLSQEFGDITIINSLLGRFMGKYKKLTIINTSSRYSISKAGAMTKEMYGSNLKITFYDNFFVTDDANYQCYPLQVSDAQNSAGRPIYNLGGTSAAAKYYQIYESGSLVTRQFSST